MKELDEHSQWENEWAKAFEDARQAPPPAVWNNIHTVQANKDAEKFRKRAAYYKWIAAASVFFTICSAAILLLSSRQLNPDGGVAEHKATEFVKSEKALETDLPPTTSATGSKHDDKEVEERKPGNKIGDSKSNGNGVVIAEDNTSTATHQETESAGKGFEGGLVPEVQNNATAARRKHPGRSEAQATTHKAKTSHEVAAASGAASDTEKALDPGEESKRGGSNTEITFFNEQSLASESLAAEEQEIGSSGAETEMVPVYLGGELIPAFSDKKGLLAIEIGKGEAVEAEVRKVWVASNFLDKDKSRAVPRYMLGASLASNNFSANYLDNSPEVAMLAKNTESFDVGTKPSPLANARVTDWDDEQQSVMTVTGALQAAAWLGKRWVLQGGLQYGNYKSESMASSYTEPSGNHSYPLHFSNYSADKGEQLSFKRTRAAEPVAATNSFQFLSVPLSIGYVVVDGKLSLLLTPGLSSEFFLGNKISAEEGSDLSTYTVSNGENSPFSLVHFKGLIGAQLFYRMSDHYIISLEPGYQHAITDFNKSGSLFSSRPTNVSVAAGFRYIFH